VLRFVNSQAFANIPVETLERARDRGIDFHQLAALYAQKLFIMEIPEDCAGYFKSFCRWHDAVVEEVVLVETVLVHPVFHFRGKPDEIVRLKGDSSNWLTLPDWKTPLPLSKDWRLQLAAYRELALVNGYNVMRVASLQPKKDGKRARFEEYKTLSADFAVFLNALMVWRFYNA